MSTTLTVPSSALRPRLQRTSFGRPPGAARTPELSHPLFCVVPPYERERPLMGGAAHPLAAGAVLVLDISPVPAELGAVETELRRLRTAAPSTPIVVRTAPEIDDLLRLATLGATLPTQGVILRGQPLHGALRGQLSRPRNLPAEVSEWLSLKGVRMAPALSEFIRQVFARAPQHSEISSLCREIGAVESSARFRCSKKRLPAPSRWLQAARALHACLRLQSEPDRALLPLALDMGYADHSALSHQVRRAFGVRPAEVRRTLGWAWLLDRWLDLSRDRGRG